MITTEDILNNNPKLEIFNEIDKYINDMPYYFIKYKYLNNIINKYEKLVMQIDNTIGCDRYYKTENGMVFYIYRPDHNLISTIFDSYYFEHEHRVLLVYKLLKLAKDYNM